MITIQELKIIKKLKTQNNSLEPSNLPFFPRFDENHKLST